VRDAAFNWNAGLDWKNFRIGYLKDSFDPDKPAPVERIPEGEIEEQKKRRERNEREDAARRVGQIHDLKYDLAALDKLHALGVNLIPLKLPDLPYESIRPILNVEAAAAFDEVTITGRDKLLTQQGPSEWPNSARLARFYPAIEYIQANRARSLAIREVSAVFGKVDVVVASSFSEQLLVTNLTGHPAVIVPNGIRGADAPLSANADSDNQVNGPSTPVSITFLGNHYQDAKICAFAKAYQEATRFQKLHPDLR
jgi:Asp-tRNA(Asn)/Glu-tRNA(Gln) amidotransferase A subunit family amidase